MVRRFELRIVQCRQETASSRPVLPDAPLKKWTSIYRYTSAVRIQLENNIPVLSVTFFCCKNG